MKRRSHQRLIPTACQQTLAIALLVAGGWITPPCSHAHDLGSLNQQANQAYENKDFAKSAEYYLDLVEHGEKNGYSYYNVACTLALAGQNDKAFRYLGLAIDHGFNDSEQLLTDSDLKGLHEDPRWGKIVERSKSKSAAEERLFESEALDIPYSENLTFAEKMIGLSKLWAEVRYNFINFEMVPDLDWDALYLEYSKKIEKTSSTYEYYKALQGMIAHLRDGHTNVSYPRELIDKVYARPLLRTDLIENRVIVTRLFKEELKQEGIQVGTELIAIDGIDVKTYAENNVRPYISASTQQDSDVRTYNYLLLAGSAEEDVELTLARSDGKTFRKTLRRWNFEDSRKYVTPARPAPMVFKMLPGNIAYVQLNTFGSNEAAEKFKESYPEIADSEALILDLRRNGGGNSNVGYEILAHLTDQSSIQTSRWYTKSYRPAFRAWRRSQTVYGTEEGRYYVDNDTHYTQPVIVLIGAKTYSAAEDFTIAFQLMKRGKILGEPTGGSTGQPVSFSLPGGGSARVCSKRDLYPDGREFVGVGIQPDAFIEQTVDDLRAGKDTVLEAALLEIESRMPLAAAAGGR